MSPHLSEPRRLNGSGRMREMARALRFGLLAFAAVGLAGWVLYAQFGGLSLSGLRSAFEAQSAMRVVAALGLTALSFAALASYDIFGVGAVAPRRVPARVALLAGATANAISHTLGFHAVTGSLVRTQIYLRHGLNRTEVIRIVSLSWLALGLGLLAMLAASEFAHSFTTIGRPASQSAAFGITAGLSAFVLWLRGERREVRCLGFRQPLPTARAALLQMTIGTVESAAAIGALYVLVPSDLAPPFSAFAVGCIAAMAVGVVVHVPGGIGVFEAGMTALLSGAGRADLLAALLVYRVVYNLLPFAVSVAALTFLGYFRSRNVNSTAGTD